MAEASGSSSGGVIGLDVGARQSRVAVIRGDRAELVADADGHQCALALSSPLLAMMMIIMIIII